MSAILKRRNQGKDILLILIFQKPIIKFRKINDNKISRQRREKTLHPLHIGNIS